MIPNDVLSPQLKVKNLLKGDERAVFKLMNMDKVEAGREEKTRPETYTLSHQKTVIDPFAENGNQIIIGNVTGQERRVDKNSGNAFFIPRTESVKFIHGYLTLTAEKNNTFQYVMRRAENESNPFGKKMAMTSREKTPLFKLVNDRNEIKQASLQADLRFQAEKMIRETLKASDLKALAGSLNKSPDNRLHIPSYNPPMVEDVQAIKYDILQRVPLFAKQIIYASGDTNSRLKVQIMEGLTCGVLTFDEGAFHLLGSDMTELHRPAPDEDKTDSLIAWFLTEKEMYDKFAKEVKKALKVDLTK